MVKGPAKFGGKSGVLPVVREIFKKPIKPVVRVHDPNVGYAEGIPEPRGTSREQKLPEVLSVKELIKKTVPAPKGEPKKLSTLQDAQRQRLAKANLRRQYYISSLKKEQIRLDETAKKAIQKEEYLKRKEEENKVVESPAAKLTLPTISSYLKGPLMRPRTDQEKAVLLAKRRANRLNIELKIKTSRASNLLKLYYSAENFIINETDLEKAVEEAFLPGNEHIPILSPDQMGRQYNETIGDALFGTIHNKPGLVEVEEQVNGGARIFKEQIEEAARQRLKEERERELALAAEQESQPEPESQPEAQPESQPESQSESKPEPESQ